MDNIKVPKIIRIFISIILMLLTLVIIFFYNFMSFVNDISNIIILFFSFLVIILNIFFIKKPIKFVFLGFLGFIIYLGLNIYILFFFLQNGFGGDIFYQIGYNFLNISEYGLIDIILFIFSLFILLFYITVFIAFSIFLYKLIKYKNELKTGSNKFGSVYISYFIFLIGMFLFYFLYYNIPVKVQYVDDNFFVTRFNDIKNREDVLLKYANDIDKILDNFSEDDIDYIQKLYICLTKHDGGNMEELYSKYKEFKLSSEKTLNINDCFTQDFDTKLIINKEKEIDNKIKKLLSLKEENYKEKVEKLRDYQLSLSKISTKEYKEKYIYDIGFIKQINNFNDIIKNILKEDVLVENLNNEGLYGPFLKYIRMSFSVMLYYLDSNEEDKAIDLVLNNYFLGKKIMDGESGMIRLLVGNTISSISLKELNYIIENYNLSNKNKSRIIMVLKEKLNNDNNFSNSMKIEYKNEKKLLMNIKNNLFFNIVDANNLLKFKYFYIIDNKYNFDNDNEYIHFYSYRNPLKRNYMGTNMILDTLGLYVTQFNKLNYLSIYKKEILKNILKQ